MSAHAEPEVLKKVRVATVGKDPIGDVVAATSVHKGVTDVGTVADASVDGSDDYVLDAADVQEEHEAILRFLRRIGHISQEDADEP